MLILDQIIHWVDISLIRVDLLLVNLCWAIVPGYPNLPVLPGHKLLRQRRKPPPAGFRVRVQRRHGLRRHLRVPPPQGRAHQAQVCFLLHAHVHRGGGPHDPLVLGHDQRGICPLSDLKIVSVDSLDI